jgi:hypothetical protein
VPISYLFAFFAILGAFFLSWILELPHSIRTLTESEFVGNPTGR